MDSGCVSDLVCLVLSSGRVAERERMEEEEEEEEKVEEEDVGSRLTSSSPAQPEFGRRSRSTEMGEPASTRAVGEQQWAK